MLFPALKKPLNLYFIMRHLFIPLLLAIICCVSATAQDYNIRMAGQAANGGYYVKVTTVLDKKQNKTAVDYVKKMAVDGVMLRGVAAGSGYGSQPPIIEDPDVARLKAEFFDAFNAEGRYNNFCSVEPSLVSVTQLPKKRYEVSALVTVDKERLIRYLTECQIIKNFDSLW